MGSEVTQLVDLPMVVARQADMLLIHKMAAIPDLPVEVHLLLLVVLYVHTGS
jgi:hypothetical protein